MKKLNRVLRIMALLLVPFCFIGCETVSEILSSDVFWNSVESSLNAAYAASSGSSSTSSSASTSSSTSSSNPTITVVNNTGYNGLSLYVSPSTSSDWGSDVLGSSTLANGNSFTVRLPVSLGTTSRYDLRLVDTDNDSYMKMGVTVAAGSRIVFTFSDFAGQSSSSSSSTASASSSSSSTASRPSTTTPAPTASSTSEFEFLSYGLAYRGRGGNVVFPSTFDGRSVTVLEYSGYKNITSVTIPYGVRTIITWTFSNNQLTNVTFPSSITSIGSNAFADNQLRSIDIPSNDVVIYSGAFLGNHNLTTIRIGNNATSPWQLGWQAPFENDFWQFYIDNGRRGGTYTRQVTGWIWIAR